MLEEIDRIVVFPTYLELHLNLSRMIGMTELELLPEGNQECIRIEYENLFNYKENKAEEREQIIELLKEKPDSTAVSIAVIRYTLPDECAEERRAYQVSPGRSEWVLGS